MSKKLQEKQRKRLAEEKRRAEMKRAQRRRNLITTIIAIIVAAGVVWLVLSDSTPKSGGVTDPLPPMSAEEAGCGDIQDAEPQEATHIEQGAEHDDYNTNPPTSGAHYAAPLAPIDTGFYSEDVEAEKVLHNLEHGMIAIYYNPDAPQDTIDDIEQVTDQVPGATLAVPWRDFEEPTQLALAAWGSYQECVQVSQEVVDEFRTQFQGKGPEAVGIPTFEG
ncbi:MAG TPA: DUF3105 domain-containing protein [Actinomycetota bacterium]